MDKLERQRRRIAFLFRTKAPSWLIEQEQKKLEDMVIKIIGGNENEINRNS